MSAPSPNNRKFVERAILIAAAIVVCTPFCWSYLLQPRDIHLVAIKVIKIANTRDLDDIPRAYSNARIIEVFFTSYRDFSDYSYRHQTSVVINAYPCEWVKRDENNDQLGLSYFLYDEKGEIGVGPRHNSRQRIPASKAIPYHFYSSLKQWNVGSRKYDLEHRPVDICFSLFGSGNVFGLSFGQEWWGTAPWYWSDTIVIPRADVISAMKSGHWP